MNGQRQRVTRVFVFFSMRALVFQAESATRRPRGFSAAFQSSQRRAAASPVRIPVRNSMA